MGRLASACTCLRFSPMMFTVITRGPRMSLRVELMTYNEEIFQVAMTHPSTVAFIIPLEEWMLLQCWVFVNSYYPGA